MAFEKVIALIEKADKMDRIYRMLEDCGEDYCEPDELEDRQDQAYEDRYNACMELARYLQIIIVGCELPTAREMAFSEEKRAHILALFKRAN